MLDQSFISFNIQDLLSPGIAAKAFASILSILLIWIVKKVTIRMILRKQKDVTTQYLWRKNTDYISSIFYVLVLGLIWVKGFQSLATYLGLLSAGIAISLKDVISNMAGWAFIMWRRPFEVGDRIEIDNQKGDIIDIRLFQFTVLEIENWVDADQSTGRIIHIPNSKAVTHSAANYTKGFNYIWNELAVTVTFESNWEVAKQLLQDIANTHATHLTKSAEHQIKQAARKFLIFYSKLTPIVYTSVQDCGVCLTIRYLTEPRGRRSSEHLIWEDVLTEFAKHEDIDFAYPTQRFYNNISEGKKTKPLVPGEGPPI